LKKGATYDGLVRVPEHFVAEMFDGELYASPRPAYPCARAAVVLVGKLGGAFDFGDGPGGWWIYSEPELHFGNDVLVPDLAGWRRERLPSLPNDAYLTLAPDWICEVLSPSTEAIDRGKKLGIYARNVLRTHGSSIRCVGRSKCWRSNPEASSKSSSTTATRLCGLARSTLSSSSCGRSGARKAALFERPGVRAAEFPQRFVGSSAGFR
jgi:hypothetical protein